MQFHPVEPLLCTAGEDGTMKLWNLSRAQPDDAKSTISDLDPVYTFRAHRSAVLALVLSPTGDMAYTAGADGTVRCWMLPSPNNDQYDKYGWCARALSAKHTTQTRAPWLKRCPVIVMLFGRWLCTRVTIDW
jgi:striatin 1/3/4